MATKGHTDDAILHPEAIVPYASPALDGVGDQRDRVWAERRGRGGRTRLRCGGRATSHPRSIRRLARRCPCKRRLASRATPRGDVESGGQAHCVLGFDPPRRIECHRKPNGHCNGATRSRAGAPRRRQPAGAAPARNPFHPGHTRCSSFFAIKPSSIKRCTLPP